MKIRKKLGSPEIQPAIEAAVQRAREVSQRETVRDPWDRSPRTFSSETASLSSKSSPWSSNQD